MFLIHSTDLLRRRKRCKPIVSRILNLDQASVTACNICGSSSIVILADVDRYGVPIRTGLCRDCGLIFLIDRLTESSYAEFYATGTYRALIAKFKGVEQTIARIRAAQEHYADRLVNSLRGYVQPTEGGRLLDVGGSTGLVAHRFAEEYGFKATLLDPAPAEVGAAQELGVEAVQGSIETWECTQQFDMILLCRTIEHLYDLRAALTKIRTLLKPGGLFFCDIADYLEICRREGPPEAVSKVDHCYWLTQESAPGIFGALGFEVLVVEIIAPDQIGFLLRPCEPSEFGAGHPAWIDEQVRCLREIRSDWQRFSSRAYDTRDWFRRRAYYLKKRFRS